MAARSSFASGRLRAREASNSQNRAWPARRAGARSVDPGRRRARDPRWRMALASRPWSPASGAPPSARDAPRYWTSRGPRHAHARARRRGRAARAGSRIRCRKDFDGGDEAIAARARLNEAWGRRIVTERLAQIRNDLSQRVVGDATSCQSSRRMSSFVTSVAPRETNSRSRSRPSVREAQAYRCATAGTHRGQDGMRRSDRSARRLAAAHNVRPRTRIVLPGINFLGSRQRKSHGWAIHPWLSCSLACLRPPGLEVHAEPDPDEPAALDAADPVVRRPELGDAPDDGRRVQQVVEIQPRLDRPRAEPPRFRMLMSSWSTDGRRTVARGSTTSGLRDLRQGDRIRAHRHGRVLGEPSLCCSVALTDTRRAAGTCQTISTKPARRCRRCLA